MPNPGEEVRYLRDEDLGVELLSAHYVTHRFGLHTHDTYVVGVVVDGAARFTSAGHSYLSARGTVMLIEPEEAHTGGPGAKSGWTYRMLYPSPALLRRVAEQVVAAPAAAPTFQPRVIEDPELARALCSAHAAIERRADALEKESRLLDAFGLLIGRYASGTPRTRTSTLRSTGEHAAVAQRVRAYVEENFAARLTLAEIAQVAEVSPFHLVRILKKELGLPPHAFLNQVRVRRAKELLKQGVPPAEVAISVGFCDQSHFGRHFKRTVGISPACFAV
jgi:AraC-like DNA-binding protein